MPVWALALALVAVVGFVIWRRRSSTSSAAAGDTGAPAQGSLFPSASGGASGGSGALLGAPPQSTGGGTQPPASSGAEPSSADQALFQQTFGVTFQQSAYYWANYGGGQSALSAFIEKYKREHPNVDAAMIDRLYQGVLFYMNNPTVAGGDTGTVGTATSAAGPIQSDTMGEFSPATPGAAAPTLIGPQNVGDVIQTTFDTGPGLPVGSGGIAPAGSWSPVGPAAPNLPPNLALDTMTQQPPASGTQQSGNPNILGPGAVL